MITFSFIIRRPNISSVEMKARAACNKSTFRPSVVDIGSAVSLAVPKQQLGSATDRGGSFEDNLARPLDGE